MPGGIERPCKSWWPRTKPRPSLAALATRLAKRGGPQQGLTCIGPPIRMRVVGVVDVHKVTQTHCEIVGRGKIAAFEKTTGQDAKPQLDLIEP